MSCQNIARTLASVIAFSVGVSGAARADLITNGNFETTSSATNGQLNYSGYSVTGWTNQLSGSSGNVGYTFLYRPASGTSGTSADTTGANGYSGNVKLWGPGTGVNNGLTLSPAGGNFIASDPNYFPAPLTQSLTGLTVGQQYNVSFYWAGAQQSGFNGATTQWWQVSLGSQTLNTSTVNVPNHGFSGWQLATLTFTAQAVNQNLSFLAKGTPSDSNLPPFVLLDGVSMNAVPEPSTVVMVGLGLAGLVGVGIRRRARVENA